MIPGVMVDFLARASVAVASTRDEMLKPRIHFLSGWAVDDDRTSVVCLVPAPFAAGLDESVARRGDFAMTAEVIGPHECYQFKGRVIDSRPPVDSDRTVTEACRRRFVEAVGRHMHGRFSDDSLRARVREPALAVRFEVHEIFVQTPGPSAGRRVFPPERS